jgi:hypothetical protein
MGPGVRLLLPADKPSFVFDLQYSSGGVREADKSGHERCAASNRLPVLHEKTAGAAVWGVRTHHWRRTSGRQTSRKEDDARR